jgi:Ca2+-binding EF-hand superfamily protein
VKLGKWLSVLLIFLLAAVLLTGCNSAEKGFFNLSKEGSNHKIYEETGEISIDIKQLPLEFTEDKEEDQLIAQQLLKGFSLTYKAEVDSEKQIMELTCYLKEKDANKEQRIFSFINVGNTGYINVRDLLQLIKIIGSPELYRQMGQAFGNAEYLSISNQELSNMLQQMDAELEGDYFQSLLDMNYQKKQQALYERLIEGLMQDVYDKYESGIVRKEGNKYIISMDAHGFVKLIRPFMAYTIDNIDSLGTFLKKTVNSLEYEEFKMLGLDPEEEGAYLESIDAFVIDVKDNGSQYLVMLEEAAKEAEKIANDIFDGSKLIATFEKLGSTGYKSNMELNIAVKDPEQPKDGFAFELHQNDIVKVRDSIGVSAPVTDIISFTEFHKRLPKVMNIEVYDNYYSLSQGLLCEYEDMEVNVLDNETMVPMRQVAEAFDEKVGWDKKVRMGYIYRDNKKVYMSGIIINERLYVKVRAFEKMGYMVQWNSETGTVTIQKR